ncbi:tRNA (adenosine(37)-N6)-threonylcarbamoyltransferase complex dimerization subunit type 1 TsaB [Ascidiimonas sp. W6]|uniref:tRNA (adenosine(37)-N6)-threonylcarbamoyltransferase complex dimerization subunit type 1 TsaB n=1 Tax=Ascidiimonas meishanensis TaxID=3128903 RepID=UPI0030ECE2BF
MAVILQIETTTTNCSVGISKDGELVAIKEKSDDKYLHAESLHLFIEEALKDASFLLEEVDAVAVSMGPGSYTGLRIGVSAAKGLCFALEKPLISVSTLESMAHQLKINKGWLVPMLDARRMEVYTAVFDNAYKIMKPVWAEVVTKDSFQQELASGEVHFLGNGATKCKELIKHSNAIFHDEIQLPSARQMTMLAYKKFKIGSFENVAYFEPYYLKDFMGTKSKK